MIKRIFKTLKFILIGLLIIGVVYQLFLEEGLHPIPIIIWSIFLLLLLLLLSFYSGRNRISQN